MRALVMAAGLGTRLKPLTDSLPKPMVLLGGKPMIEYVLQLLPEAGIQEAMLNIHYLPDKMRSFAEAWNQDGHRPRISLQDETAEILGSGGALVRAKKWLFQSDSTALVCNADVLASPNLKEFITAHQRAVKKHGILCTLAVMEHPEAGQKYTGLKVQSGMVQEFIERGKGQGGLYHFPGFYLIEAEAVETLGQREYSFSIVERLWRGLAEQGKLGAWNYEGVYLDLGTVSDLEEAEIFLSRR